MTRIEGLDLHVAPAEGDGELLVLVHGSWTDHTTWDLVAGPLAETYRVVRYDRRGHSRSRDAYAGPAPRRSDEDDLAALVEVLGEPGHLVGTSYGGSIALSLAARRPDLVRSVVAHEPPLLSLAPDPGAYALIAGVQAQLARGEIEVGTRRFFEDVALGPGGWGLLPAPLREAAMANAQTFLDMRVIDDWDVLDVAALAASGRPVTVTAGDASPAWLQGTALATARFVGCALEVVHGAGHAPHLSHPDALVALVRERARDARPGGLREAA